MLEKEYEEYYYYLWKVFKDGLSADDLVYVGKGTFEVKNSEIAEKVDAYNFNNLPLHILINKDGLNEYNIPLVQMNLDNTKITGLFFRKGKKYYKFKLDDKRYNNFCVLIDAKLYNYPKSKVIIYCNRFYELRGRGSNRTYGVTGEYLINLL